MEQRKPISPDQSKRPSAKVRLTIPWVNTSLVTDIRLYFISQPLLWLLGLELILPAMLAVWMLIKYLFLNLKIRIPRFFWWAILFAAWQLIHVVTLPEGEADLFIKSQGTWLAIMCLFLIIYNVADTPYRWHRILNGMEIFCGIVVVLGLFYILEIFRFEYVSLLGRVLPQSLIENSHFFSEISIRTFGKFDFFGVSRVRATFWHPSSYATALMAIFAIQLIQLQRSRGRVRAIKLLFLGLTLVNLIFTFSRTTYVAFLIMLAVIWWLQGRSFISRWQKLIIVSMGIIVLLAYLLISLLLSGAISFALINNFLYDFRPFSIISRMRVYEASWDLVLQRPFWGWGTLIKLEGLPSQYSAGSHSDYLNVLFRFGIPGFLLYMALILALIRALWKAYLSVPFGESKYFLRICFALMIGMLIRQITSELYWDLYVVSLLWGVWGLGLARSASKNFDHPGSIAVEGRSSPG